MIFLGKLLPILLVLFGHIRTGDAAELNFQVVVHPTNPVTFIDQKHLAEIFLKKRTFWADNRSIEAVDLDAYSRTRMEFSETVLERPISAIRIYWQQLLFSGRGVPPPEFESEDAVLEFIATHEGAIGYVSNRSDLKDLKTIPIR